jgi:hypothetical protein
MAQAPLHKTLVGQWAGTVEFADGRDFVVESFKLDFSVREGQLQGFLVLTQRERTPVDPPDGVKAPPIAGVRAIFSPLRRQPMEMLQLVPTEGPDRAKSISYRWTVAGDCWNVNILGDLMQGGRNGGECGPLGIGSGARITPLSAHKLRR